MFSLGHAVIIILRSEQREIFNTILIIMIISRYVISLYISLTRSKGCWFTIMFIWWCTIFITGCTRLSKYNLTLTTLINKITSLIYYNICTLQLTPLIPVVPELLVKDRNLHCLLYAK